MDRYFGSNMSHIKVHKHLDHSGAFHKYLQLLKIGKKKVMKDTGQADDGTYFHDGK